MSTPEKRPDCFGRLDQVFPLGEEGLRQVRPSCDGCGLVKDCLAAAARSPEGVEMRARRTEAAQRDQGRGLIGFLNRWSELKASRRRPKGD
ncbi:MAG: hypothetical protein AB1896_13075 [Thermodesulfobacteriota bacterium]